MLECVGRSLRISSIGLNDLYGTTLNWLTAQLCTVVLYNRARDSNPDEILAMPEGRARAAMSVPVCATLLNGPACRAPYACTGAQLRIELLARAHRRAALRCLDSGSDSMTSRPQ